MSTPVQPDDGYTDPDEYDEDCPCGLPDYSCCCCTGACTRDDYGYEDEDEE